MKNLAIICAALLVVGMVASVQAGEVSKSTLASMGYSSAQTLSDMDGMAVRGKGWSGHGGTSASVGGTSSALYFDPNAGGSTSSNNYAASSSSKHGSSLAKGNDRSFAGYELTTTNHWGTKTTTFYIVSGGNGFAFAK